MIIKYNTYINENVSSSKLKELVFELSETYESNVNFLLLKNNKELDAKSISIYNMEDKYDDPEAYQHKFIVDNYYIDRVFIIKIVNDKYYFQDYMLYYDIQPFNNYNDLYNFVKKYIENFYNELEINSPEDVEFTTIPVFNIIKYNKYFIKLLTHFPKEVEKYIENQFFTKETKDQLKIYLQANNFDLI
jgi:hypothetical protein